MTTASRDPQPPLRALGSATTFSATSRPPWQLDHRLDVPMPPETLDPATDPARVMRVRFLRGEVRLPTRVPSAAPPRHGVARVPTRTIASLPASGSAFDGCLAVGPNHLVVAENFGVAVYSKQSGTLISSTSLAGWFPNLPAAATFVFDPRALYDQYAHRWVLVALAWDQPTPSDPLHPIHGSWLLVSVSDSDDPTGHWRTSILDTFDGTVTPPSWADYPSLGIDERAVYIAYNVRGDKSRVMIFAKTNLYDAGTAAFFDFPDRKNPDGSTASSVQPCHHFGPGDSAYLVNTVMNPAPANPGTLSTLWEATWSAGTPALSARSVDIHDFLSPIGEAEQAQEKALYLGGARVRSAVCRGDSVWFAFATAYDHNGRSLTAARWCRLAASTATRNGGDDLAADGAHYAFPGLAVDGVGNLTMVASRSAANEFPSLHYGAWPASGSPATGVLVAGRGPHLKCRGNVPCDKDGARNGWGDYNGIAVDPDDDATVWVFGGAGHETDKTLWAMTIAAL